MTQKQLSTNLDKLLRDFTRRVEAASTEQKIRMMRVHLRETHGLVFVNARPYFRQYTPKTTH